MGSIDPDARQAHSRPGADAGPRVRGGRQQWVVTFRNDAIKNANKQMLYVVLTPGGDYISSSSTPD